MKTQELEKVHCLHFENLSLKREILERQMKDLEQEFNNLVLEIKELYEIPKETHLNFSRDLKLFSYQEEKEG
jgi:hypothetical protein